VNPKIAGKWMFIPLKMVCIGIDPYPCWILNSPETKSNRSKSSDSSYPQSRAECASSFQQGKTLTRRIWRCQRETDSSSPRVAMRLYFVLSKFGTFIIQPLYFHYIPSSTSKNVEFRQQILVHNCIKKEKNVKICKKLQTWYRIHIELEWAHCAQQYT